MASPDAIATALAPMVKRNDELNAQLNELKNSFAPTIDRLHQLDAQLRDALADKAALEQEMLLSGAQKAARKRAWRVSGIPKLIVLLLTPPTMVFFFLCILHPAFQPYFMVQWVIGGTIMMLAVVTLRPTDVMGIRVAGAMVPGQAIFMCALPAGLVPYLMITYVDYPSESMRYEQLSVLCSGTVAFPFFVYFSYKTMKHRHGARMPFVAGKDLKAWARLTLITQCTTGLRTLH